MTQKVPSLLLSLCGEIEVGGGGGAWGTRVSGHRYFYDNNRPTSKPFPHENVPQNYSRETKAQFEHKCGLAYKS